MRNEKNILYYIDTLEFSRFYILNTDCRWVSMCVDKYHGRNKNTCEKKRLLSLTNQIRVRFARLLSTNEQYYSLLKKSLARRHKDKRSSSNALLTISTSSR